MELNLKPNVKVSHEEVVCGAAGMRSCDLCEIGYETLLIKSMGSLGRMLSVSNRLSFE